MSSQSEFWSKMAGNWPMAISTSAHTIPLHIKPTAYPTPYKAHLDVLDQVGSAVGHFLGSLHKVSLGHWIAGLAASHFAGIAQDTGVLGNHCGSCQHLLLVGGWIEQVLTCCGDGLRERGRGRGEYETKYFKMSSIQAESATLSAPPLTYIHTHLNGCLSDC